MRQRRGLIIILLLALAAVGSLSLVIYLLSLSQPGDQSVAESVHNDRVCVIGWANSHMQVSTNGGGYIPYADLTASAPAGAQIKVIDLNSATNPVTTTNFADIDILFISDAGDDSQRTNYVSPTNAQLGVINAAFNAGMHVVIGSDNSGTAAIGRQFAAMMGMPVTNNLASPQLRFLDTIRTVDPLQGTITSTYPLFNGLAYDTTGSAITPGIMTYQAPGECIASVNQLNTTSPQCFVGYLPRTTAAGFLIVDGNGGRIAKQIIANSSIWDEVSDCAPYAPSCGNGILDTDTGEQCDDGGQNGAVCTPAYGGSCTYCSSTCQIVSVTGPYCGDANVDPEEECDNDGQNGMQCTPAYGGSCTYCSSECLNVELTGPYCGDGNIDTGDGELCDDNGSNGVSCIPAYASSCSYCSTACQPVNVDGPYCGDGIINGSEQCDGSAVPGVGDICTPSCTLAENLLIDKSSVVVSVDNTQAVIQYSITVTNPNNIPMTASVVDQLPGFVQSANVTGISNGGVFNNTNKTITWNPLNLPANGSVTVTYTLTVAAANFGTIDNLAIVYDETGQEDDRDTESNVIDPNIEVLVNKNHSSQTVSGSTVVNYTVRLQNIGTTSLVNLTVRDTLDNAIQTSWVSNISGGGSIAGTVITWTGINLQPGQTLTLTYTVTFPAGMFGTFDNVVVVTDPGGDQLGTDNDSVTIPPLDILIDKSSSIVSLDNSQGVIRYSITVTNPNLLQVTTRVVDQLPAFVQAGDVTNISNGGVFDAASKTITWDPLVIPASGSVTLTYTLTVNSANFGEIYNVAVVYGEDGQEDDRDAESVILDPDINLYVNKSHTRQIVNGATVVTYTIEVTNTGANALLNLTVQDNLPSGVLPSWVSNISGGGTLSSGVITWTGVNLQPQQSIQLSYTVTFPDGIAGTFRNLVIVRGPNGEELGQDSDPISISVVTPTPTVPGVSLPDTAIFGEEADLVIIGVLLLIIGLLVYQLEIRSGFGRFILGKPLNAIFGARDDYEENAIKQVSRNLKHRKKK